MKRLIDLSRGWDHKQGFKTRLCRKDRCLMPQEKVVDVDVLSSWTWTWNVILIRNIVGETWGDESGTSGRQVVMYRLFC